MADLLAEASSPAPRFAAVVCEDIERSGRDMFNALKLEKELSRQGIPLFATDEPADIEGVNATTVLVRRVKQGVAEWYRLQLKEKVWKGLRRAFPGRVEHRHPALRVRRRPHPPPGPVQGRPGPHQVPARHGPGPRPRHRRRSSPGGPWTSWACPAIAARLNADPAAYPPPNPAHRVDGPERPASCCANPKYTGHMVYGRHRTRNGRRTPRPPGPVAVVTRPRCTPPSWTGPPGTPPRTSPPGTAPAATETT